MATPTEAVMLAEVEAVAPLWVASAWAACFDRLARNCRTRRRSSQSHVGRGGGLSRLTSLACMTVPEGTDLGSLVVMSAAKQVNRREWCTQLGLC